MNLHQLLDPADCTNVTTAFPLQYFAFLWIEDLGLTYKGDSSLTFRKDYSTLVLLGTEKDTKGNSFTTISLLTFCACSILLYYTIHT